MRPRAPQGDPGDGRARHLRRSAPREHPRHGGRRRFHQDLDRQGAAGCDAPRRARDDGVDPRLRPRDGSAGRLQGRGGNSHRQASHCLSRVDVRDIGSGLDDSRPAATRRVDAAQRCADAGRQGAHRRLPVPGLLHDRLMALTKKQTAELAKQVFEYAPAPESIDHVKIQPRYGLFIGGRMVEGHSKKRFPTINPATETKLAEVVEADDVDVDRAVKAADKAFDSWAHLAPSQRARYLFRISRLIQERSRELAVVETMDGGKPIKESRDVDIPLAAAHFFYYAGSGKRLTLELGGKAANIVFEDAPLDQAVEGIINGIYFNQGHVCCAGSRLLVQESIAEPLLEKLKRRLSTLRLGDPLDKNTDIGAINSKSQLERIQGLVESGIEEGAELYQPDCVLPERGFWFPPTLFTNVSQSYRIAREEIFGPVLSVLTFRTPNEAVEKANNTPYGLSAGVWTDKGSRILWMAERMRAGVVWANTFSRFDPASPFGGYKESGFGREGGLHGLEPYLAFE